jgi:hypothetical protein
MDFEILPDLSEPDNKRVAKISVALVAENAKPLEYECTAVVYITLYDRNVGEVLFEGQEVRKFAGRNRVKLLTDLGSQERIEKSINQCLEVSLRVKLQLRRICYEYQDGYTCITVM